MINHGGRAEYAQVSLRRMTKRVPALLIALAGVIFPATGSAQADAWPGRPVHVLATSPPGGSVDLLARLAAEEFTRAFGQPFVVENRPGANGNIGAELVLKAPADGHMLFVAPTGPFSINAQLMPTMPFDPARDIAPVALLGVSPLLLVVHPSVPATTVPELIAWMKARQGRVDYASQAVASTGHLAMELFKAMAGVEATHIPYKGSAAQATADLLAGRVAVSFVNTSTTIPHIRKGQLRAIAVAERRRLAVAPEIPTVDESGLPGFEATTWIGLGARAGTPPEVVARLNEAAARGLARPETAERLARIGVESRAMSPEAFAAFVRTETDKWGAIIRRSGARVE
jgi:tripartite-type tricarboxylate transporter receptor subunit TctC